MKKNNLVYIEDIVDATNKVLAYTDGMNFEDFSQDTLTVDAVIRNFGVIGEASNKLSTEFIEQNNFPVKKAVSMRNKLIHDYGEINLEIVWKTIKRDLPKLLEICKMLL